VNDGLVDLDMSGSDPQVRSAYNVPTMGRRTYWLTFRLTTVLTTFDPLMPHNAGLYRGITVKVPRGSVLRAEFPDAMGDFGIDVRSEEAISALGNGLDVAGVLGIIAQRLPQFANGYTEAAVEVDKRIVAPDAMA